MFGPFSCKTEADVRERIVYPMLLALGHDPETINTGLYLKYHRRFLGRKKPDRDPILRGRPDYVVEVDDRLRVVVEAKDPGEIDEDEREQTFSYAVHAQVRAVLFVLISGTNFEIWATVAKPGADPILSFRYEDLDANWPAVSRILTPEAIRKRFREFEWDIGEPLAPGWGSVARVESGTQTYLEVPAAISAAKNLKIHFTDGSISRTERGGIVIVLKPSHPFQGMDDFQKIVAELLELETYEAQISCDPCSPTIFAGQIFSTIPKGTLVPHPEQLNEYVESHSAYTVAGAMEMKAHLAGNKLIGDVLARAKAATGELVEVRTRIELSLR